MIPRRQPGNAWGYPGIALFALGITTMSAHGQVAGGLATAGPAKAAIEQWFAGGRDIVCTDVNGVDQACDAGRILALRAFYDDAGTGLAFVAYTPAVGNAVSLAVGQFRRAGPDWTFVRKVEGIYGEGPTGVTFDKGTASFSMAAFMPGDARCCLTGTQRYWIDLASGRVTAGARVAAGGPPPNPAAPVVGESKGTAYTHNGSLVLVDERAGEIRYDDPRPGMRGVVGQGTLLFKGTFAAGGPVSGTAYAFKAGCEPAPYAVTGTRKGSDIVLRGMAPRRAPDDCAVTGMSASGGHAVLRFREYGDL
ncbi:hypothetical protein [Methylobacterium sp. D54C]